MKLYYPINKKPEVKVYKYINPNNDQLSEYWKISTDPQKKTILTESYDAAFNLYNTFKEKVNKKDAELLEYIEYEDQNNFRTAISSTITKNKVFSSSKLDPYNYAVVYTNQYGKFSFEKKRQFIGFEKIDIQGEQYKAAKFKDEYFIHAIDLKDQYKFYQFAYYAEGIGMVKYERFIPTGEIRVLELEKILTENEFKELKNN